MIGNAECQNEAMIYARIRNALTGTLIGWLAAMQWGLLDWRSWAILIGWVVASTFFDLLCKNHMPNDGINR